jgi:hypothetical protein
MPLMLGELLSVSLVSNARDDFSQRHLIAIAAHHRHRPKLKPFGAVHRPNDNAVTAWYCLRLEPLARDAGGAERRRDALGDQLARASEHGNLVECESFVSACA